MKVQNIRRDELNSLENCKENTDNMNDRMVIGDIIKF